jgi:hypothetical protein
MTLKKAHRIAMRESGLDKVTKLCYNSRGGKKANGKRS